MADLSAEQEQIELRLLMQESYFRYEGLQSSLAVTGYEDLYLSLLIIHFFIIFKGFDYEDCYMFTIMFG